MAARPIGSGHLENAPEAMFAPTLFSKALRGSELIVIGMPRRVSSASFCRALCQAASVRGRHRLNQIEMREVRFAHHGTGGFRADKRHAFDQCAIIADADHAVEHQPGFFFERHLPEQILDALRDGPARVFIWIHAAIFVEIAECRWICHSGLRRR